MADYDFYGSEAEHLNEIYGYGGCSEPYSKDERRDYCLAKSHSFKNSDVGKYVVCQTPRKRGIIPILYLVNRAKSKDYWWSHDSFYAMVFEKKSAAETQARKYKYNDIKVIQITSTMVYNTKLNIL